MSSMQFVIFIIAIWAPSVLSFYYTKKVTNPNAKKVWRGLTIIFFVVALIVIVPVILLYTRVLKLT